MRFVKFVQDCIKSGTPGDRLSEAGEYAHFHRLADREYQISYWSTELPLRSADYAFDCVLALLGSGLADKWVFGSGILIPGWAYKLRALAPEYNGYRISWDEGKEWLTLEKI